MSKQEMLQRQPWPHHRTAAAIMVLMLLVLLIGPASTLAQSAACAQAEDIAATVRDQLGQDADLARALEQLSTARDLCPSSAAAWTLSYCAATALGDTAQAARYKRRATLNGASGFDDCPATRSKAATAPLGPVRDKHALLIGVSKFHDPAIPDLRFSSKDAQDLRDVLIDPNHGRFAPENVHLLTDAQATRPNILNALQDLFLNAQEDDLVVVYVSSHGLPRSSAAGLGGIGYLATHETKLANVWVDAIEFEDFSQKVGLIKARRKVTLLDTCYSGQVARAGGDGARALNPNGFGLEQQTAELFLSGEGDYVITSSAESEQAWESSKIGNGYFTHYLLEALRLGDGRPPTLGEIYAHLAAQVPRAVARDKKARQNPQILPAAGPQDLRIGVLPKIAAESLAKRDGDSP